METGLYILLSDEQITAVREQIGVQKLICITIDRTVDALARLTGGWPLGPIDLQYSDMQVIYVWFTITTFITC